MIEPKGKCLGCGGPLEHGRLYACESCDRAVEHEKEQRAQRDKTKAIEREYRASGLPIDYRNGHRTREHLTANMRGALERCALTLMNAPGIGFIYGFAGRGKTSVASVLLAEWIGEGRDGRYITTPDLFADLHEIYGAHDGRSGLTVIDPLVDASALVLDDIGKEKPSDHAATVFFQLLDARWRKRRQGRWTLVVSNYQPDALVARFGQQENAEPIARRLTEGLLIEM